jgi:hypothetical protein
MQSTKAKAHVISLLIVLLAAAGCDGIQIGVETSGSQSTSPINVAIMHNASTGKSVQPDSAAWNNATTDNQTVQPSPTPEATPSGQPTNTQTELPDQPTATPSPSPAFTGKLISLYSGPSSLFPMVTQYHPDTTLDEQGITPDQQWVKVSSPNGQVGWIASHWLTSNLDEIPVIVPQEGVEVYSVYGKVIDTTNVPVDGIDIAVVAQNNSDLRTDAYSIADGSFTAYIPVGMVATSWFVNIVGINCSSRIMTSDNFTCQLHGYIELAPHWTTLSVLPQLSPLVFRYEAVDQVLQGKVTGANGQPVMWMRVFAVRDDGAYVFCSTDGAGGFSLPISNGSWTVYTVEYNPRREGEHIQLDIQNNAPTNLELHTPDMTADQ